MNGLSGIVTLTLLAGTSASAAIITTSAAAGFYGLNEIGTYSELPGGQFSAWSMNTGNELSLSMTGDMRMELDHGGENTPLRRFEYVATQSFQIDGQIPTELVVSSDVNMKVVHAGGPGEEEYGNARARARLRIYETDAYTNGDPEFNGLGAEVVNFALSTAHVYGNGYTIMDDQSASAPYVLLPGVSYTALWELVLIDHTEKSLLGSPQAATFLEAGGVTGFRGMHFTLSTVPVPTPSGIALIAMGALAGSRRRRGA